MSKSKEQIEPTEDIRENEMLPLLEAIKDETGRSVSFSTGYRWTKHRTNPLKVYLLGGRLMTTRPDVRTWIESRTKERMQSVLPSQSKDSNTDTAKEKASRELRQMINKKRAQTA